MADVVSALNDRLDDKLNFQVVDPAKAPEQAESLKKLDLLRLKWPDIAQKNGTTIASGNGTIGMLLQYQGNTAVLPVLDVVNLPFFGTRYSLPPAKDLSSKIDETLESMIGINDDIGYLTGHGTPDPNVPNTFGQQPSDEDSLINFRQLLASNYSLETTGLGGEGLEDETFDALIIARPTEPFSDYELFQIDQFLMQGKNLALFLDRYKQVYPDGQPSPYSPPRRVPVDTGLEKMLAHYGVKIGQATVMDESCFERPADPRFGQGKQPIYFAPLIKNEYINNQPAFMKNIKGLVVMDVAPVELQSDTLEANGITGTVLFSSSKRSWESKQPFLNPMFIQPPGPEVERKSYPLACLLEGEFPSYFAGKPVPLKKDKAAEENVDENQSKEKPDGAEQPVQATGQVISKGKSAKIFVMGSSQMLYDHMLDTEGRSPNAVFVMNLMDTLNGRDEVAQLRSKRQVYNPIFDISPGVRSLIKWGNIAGLPVLVILFGCLVWIRRVSRKRRIRMMFAK